MNIYFASLNPCNTRKVNAKQYTSFIEHSKHTLVSSPNEADMIFVWGCEFRNDWREFTHVVLSELKEIYSHAEIVYVGCTFTGEFASSISTSLGIDVIPWKDTTSLLEKKLDEHERKLASEELCLAEERIVDDLDSYKKLHPTERVWFEDEYVKLNICEGCRGYCTYCSEKLMFPHFRSFPENEIIAQCKELLRVDTRKKVLFLADSSGEYGKDTNSSLPKLISRMINEIGSDLRIGITQINPEHFLEYEEELLGFIKDGVIDYLNIPIQTSNNKTLKAMNRKYTSEDVQRIFDKFLQLGFSNYSTHLLVGFPGEMSEEVDENIAFLSKYKMRHIIVSAFMNHPAIEASHFSGQISDVEKRRRVEVYKDDLTRCGIKVHTDLGGISNRLMTTIRINLGIPLRHYMTY